MSAVSVQPTRHLGDGASETLVRNSAGEPIAVITHPMAGADWFLHRWGSYKQERFKTKKAAIAAVDLEYNRAA